MKTRLTNYLLIAICCCSATSMVVTAQTVNLQLQSDYTIGNSNLSPSFLAVGDVNNDRLPDLVTLNKATVSPAIPISVFLNNGAGGFSAPINIASTISPNAVALGDYNKDGNLDLAIAADGLGTGINIRLGNGTGNFPTGTNITTEATTFDIVTADFNGDGNLDLASFIDQVAATDLRVFFGNGMGGFAAPVTYTLPFGKRDLEVSDFNVDGKPDLAVAASSVIRVFLNNGAGVFTAAPDITGIGNPNRIVSADFNRDCIPDLAVSAISTGNTVRILLGNGSGGFAAQPAIPVTNQPEHMTVGDFNRDKKVDLAIRRSGTTAGQSNFTILPGNGSGGFGTAFELTLGVPTSGVTPRLATIDANLDGKADIIIGRQGGFLLYHGNSALFTRTENDFDGDLRTDLSVFRPSGGDWYIQRSTQGFFAQHWGISTDKPVAADYDGDGKTDLAVWRENGFGDPDRSYFFILRSSNSTLQQEQFGKAGDASTVVGDWDDDGRADVAVYRNGAAPGAQSFFFYRPSATAGIDFRTIYWGISGDQPIRGDFDGDGAQDAAVFRPSDAIWHISQSSNGQTVYGRWGVATDQRVPADYDGDGRTDLAIFRKSEGLWFVNRSSTGTTASYRWGISGDAAVPGDYNGDGTTEVAVFRPSEQRWYTPQCADFKMYGTKFGTTDDTPVPATLVP